MRTLFVLINVLIVFQILDIISKLS